MTGTTLPGRQSPTEWFPLPLTGGSEPDSPAPMVTCPGLQAPALSRASLRGLSLGVTHPCSPGAYRVLTCPLVTSLGSYFSGIGKQVLKWNCNVHLFYSNFCRDSDKWRPFVQPFLIKQLWVVYLIVIHITFNELKRYLKHLLFLPVLSWHQIVSWPRSGQSASVPPPR